MFRAPFRVFLAAVVFAAILAAPARAQQPEMDDALVLELSTLLVFGGLEENQAALQAFTTRGETDIVPHLILAMRYSRLGEGAFSQALAQLTGFDTGTGWNAWMTWMEKHPEIIPHAS